MDNYIGFLVKDNKIINKIKVLFWLEELIGMKRFEINEIDKIDSLDCIKNSLLADIDKIIILFEGIESKKKLINRMINKINDINYNDQLQKFVSDCYNSLGDIISYDTKKIKLVINNKVSSRVRYNNFKVAICPVL